MSKSIFLSKEELLKRDELKIEKVELSRGHVFVREMTAHERDVWEQSMLKNIPQSPGRQARFETNLDDFRSKLAVNTLCDEEGNLLFTMKEMPQLGKSLSAANMEKIVEVAQRLNAISDKDREDILGNSDSEPEKDSNSSSAGN